VPLPTVIIGGMISNICMVEIGVIIIVSLEITNQIYSTIQRKQFPKPEDHLSSL
jgi:hypothetical protein